MSRQSLLRSGAMLRELGRGPIARGAIASLGIRLSAIAVGMVQGVLTARILGAEGYGTIALILSLSNMLAVAALLGTEGLAVREISSLRSRGEPAAVRGLVRVILGVVAAGCVVMVLGFMVAWIAQRGGHVALSPYAVYLPVLGPLFALILCLQSIARAFGQVFLAQAPHMLLRQLVMVAVLLAVYLAGLGFGPDAYMLTAILGAGLALGVAVRGLARMMASLDASGSPVYHLGAWRRTAMPFFAISLVGLMLAEINTLMLGAWAGAEQTGLFQPVARMAPLVMLGMQAVAIRFTPRVSELWSGGDLPMLKRISHQTTLSTAAFAVGMGAAILVLGPWLLGLFGREFTASLPALRWVVAAQVFNALCGPAGMILTMSGKAPRSLYSQAFGLAVNVVIGALLIPAHGALGAAIAMSAGIVAWNVAMLIFVRGRVGFDPSILGALRSLADRKREG